mmetsp:Transcript_14227/g.36309  ORF Transcript_14227/g.36309 Transcript_14227/m.36309 type:complete len:160 (-) Transcript_14227:373-852(-)
MRDCMIASDLLITKAGPGTIAEALICGLPLVLSDFLPGQEYGNVTYVEQHHVGVFPGNGNADAVADAAAALLADPAELRARSARARGMATPHATADIARDLAARFLPAEKEAGRKNGARGLEAPGSPSSVVRRGSGANIPKYGLVMSRLRAVLTGREAA